MTARVRPTPSVWACSRRSPCARSGDWRAGLALGLGNLSAFRPGPGLEEVALAARLAAAAGEDAAYAAALCAADVSGRLRRALDCPF